MFSTSTLRSYFVLALALPLALVLIAGKAGTPEDALAAREAVIQVDIAFIRSWLFVEYVRFGAADAQPPVPACRQVQSAVIRQEPPLRLT